MAQQKNKRSSAKTREEIKKASLPAIPRDNLKQAFGGVENKGPAANPKSRHRGTALKSRQTQKSRVLHHAV